MPGDLVLRLVGVAIVDRGWNATGQKKAPKRVFQPESLTADLDNGFADLEGQLCAHLMPFVVLPNYNSVSEVHRHIWSLRSGDWQLDCTLRRLIQAPRDDER